MLRRSCVRVSSDFDEAMNAVKELSPPPEHVLVFPAEEGPIFDIVESPYRELLDLHPFGPSHA